MGFRVARVVLTQNSSQSSPLSQMKFVISRKAWYMTTCLSGMVCLDVGGLVGRVVIFFVCRWDGWEEVSSCFGDFWCTRGQGHNGKLGGILFLCFHFLAKRIRQSHDFCFS